MCVLKITFGLAVWMSKFCNTLPKPDLFYTRVPSIPNMAFGPTTTFSYINSPFKQGINLAHFVLPMWLGLDGFHCTNQFTPFICCTSLLLSVMLACTLRSSAGMLKVQTTNQDRSSTPARTSTRGTLCTSTVLGV